MPALKYEDLDGTFKTLAYAQRGEKGDKGDKGDPGAPGGMGPLDALSDVAAPADTPVGKVLGTTDIGLWEPIDPPPTGLSQVQADERYVNITGDTMEGALLAQSLTSYGGVEVGGRLTLVASPTATDDGANKKYVDDRIWTGTQAQYNAIVTKDPAVLYVIVG